MACRRVSRREMDAEFFVVERSDTNSGSQENRKSRGCRNIGTGISDGGCDTNREDRCKIT